MILQFLQIFLTDARTFIVLSKYPLGQNRLADLASTAIAA